MKEVINGEYKEIYVVDEKNKEVLLSAEIEINALTRQANQMALAYVVNIGSKLKAAKELVSHGQWSAWCAERINYSQTTAENYIKIYEEYGAEQVDLFGNPEALMHLPYSKALALLAVPAEDREEFVAENNVEEISVRELKELLKQKQNDSETLEKNIEALKKQKADAEQRLSEKEERIRELEELEAIPEEGEAKSQTFEPSEDDIKEIRDEIETEQKKKFEEKLKKLKEEKKELESKISDSESKILDLSEKNKSLAELKASAEKKAETLEKACENSGLLQVINVHLNSLQDCLLKIKNAVSQLYEESDAGTADKIKKGVLDLLADYQSQLR